MDTEASLQRAERDNHFYLESVTFLAEHTLFKVPKYYFETHSSFFSGLFSLPVGDKLAEGSCDENPIKVEGVNKPDFKLFLIAMYPNLVGKTVRDKIMDVHGWSAALKLSTMWGFQEIRDKAIQVLDGMLRTLPIQKISMGIEYRVQMWLLDGYGELIRREEKLLEAEARELGFETAWRIGQVREETTVKSGYKYGHHRDFGNLEAQIRTTFGDQLKDAEYMGNDPIPEIEEKRSLPGSPCSECVPSSPLDSPAPHWDGDWI